MKQNHLLSRVWTDFTTLVLPLLVLAAYALGWPSLANVLMLVWFLCFYGTLGGRPAARWRRRVRRLLRRGARHGRGATGRA
jgi:hypothetical protein